VASAGDILFGELAVRKKLISKEQLEQAYTELNEMTSAGKKRDLSLVLLRNSLVTVDQAELIMEEVTKNTKCPKCGEIVPVKPGEQDLVCEMCGNVVIEAPKSKPKPKVEEEDGDILDLLSEGGKKKKQAEEEDLAFVDVSAGDMGPGSSAEIKLDLEPEPGDIIYAEIAKEKGYLRDEDLQVAMQELVSLRQRGRKRDLSTVLLRYGYITFHQAEEVLAEYNRATITCRGCGSVIKRGSIRPGAITQCKSCGANIEVEAVDEPTLSAIEEKRLEHGEKEASWVILQEPETGEKFVGKNIGGVEISKFIGSDALGRIYAGNLHGGKREAAVRLLSPAVYGSPRESERLVQSLHDLVKLHHFNIPRVYDADIDESSHVYLVVDHYDGSRVYDLIADRGPLPEDYAFGYLKSAADALSAAHSAGVFHRNLAPEEMLLVDDRLYLTGFGLINDHDITTIFSRRRPHLHPHYFAPEIVDGGKCDARSDIFSLGACMYFLLTGKEPFPGHQASEVFLRIRDGKYISPELHNPGVSNSALNIIRKCLSPNPADRYQTTQEFLADMKRAEAGAMIEPPAATKAKGAEAVEETEVYISPRGAGFWLAILISFVIFIGAVFYLFRLSDKYLKNIDIGMSTDMLARNEFQEVMRYISENPDEIENARRRLEELIARYPQATASAEARGKLASLPAPPEDPNMKNREDTLKALTEAEKAGDPVNALEILWGAKDLFSEESDASKWRTIRNRLDSALHDKFELRFIPAGAFLKGRGKEQGETGAFLVDSCEVTCLKYAKFCKETGHKIPPDWKDGAGRAAYPVANVTRSDAEAYAAWLNGNLPPILKGKASAALPSDEEWEKAARGLDGREYPWGNVFRNGFAAVAEDEPGELSHAHKMTEGASPFGCLHMAGNAAEWTASETDGKAAIRGGSFRTPPRSVRTWARMLVPPDTRMDCIGFRCVYRLSDDR
jgi:serine/threonine-protein kinase